jgi:subtilisin-like proprotein convertase family protein
MKHTFVNDTPVTIDRFRPTDVSSTINVSGVAGRLQRVTVTIHVHHTFTRDLRMSLIGPATTPVLLVGREGGSGDHFINTTFDHASTTSITNAFPPFSGTFNPEGSLTDFNGKDPNGAWALRIEDVAFLDGGSLNHWSLALTTEEEVASEFSIDVRFLGGLTASQRHVFETAAARWSEIIIGDLPEVTIDEETIDDLIIEARGASIDGPGNVLGQAGPTRVRIPSFLPAKGIMEFDIGDLNRMEADGSLLSVIIHEMGHVLGIGTLWSHKDLLLGAGTSNPMFTGDNAMRKFADLRGAAAAEPVPVANTGGPGTRDGHWREAVFGNELMTGFLDPGENPLSRMTIGSLEDLGYAVNYNAAAPYELPSSLTLAMMGIQAEGGHGRRQCAMCGARMIRPEPVFVADKA